MRLGLLVLGVAWVAASCSGTTSKADPFQGLETHTDLASQRHLAEVDDGGWFLDFGTPAQGKYTVGDWRSGWLARGIDADATFAYVGMRGRVYFQSDESRPLVARIRLRPHGTRALTPYLNNKQLRSIHLREGPGFSEYDIALPQEYVIAGENYLLLTFGGTTLVDGQEASVAVDSIWIREEGAEPRPTEVAPVYEGLMTAVRLDEEQREAIVLSRDSTLRYHILVPEDGKIGFGVGAEGTTGVPIEVSIRAEMRAPVAALTTTASNRWRDHLVDLAEFAGRVVRVDFHARGGGPGRVAWHAPRVLRATKDVPDLEPAKNVVVLVIDTLRADKLRPFNPSTRVETPIIDRLANEGTVFELAQAPENWTKPSVASILTGLHPQTHQQKTGDSALPQSAVLLSEHLKDQGFDTGSFIANGYVSDKFGFDQGWDHYTNYIREGKTTEAKNVFKEAADWIAAREGRPFFAYIQTIDPHVPYDPPGEYVEMYDPSEYAGPVRPRMTGKLLEQAKRKPPAVTFNATDKRRIEALHDGEITQHDRFLGQFVDRLTELEIWDDTLLVITSDHGEEFDDHGSWGHGHSVYQELLHVPLIVRLPNRVPAGKRVPDAVSTMDIPATVTELLEVAALPQDEGRSLVARMVGSSSPLMPAVAFSDFQDDRRVITAGRWKFILRGNLTSTMFDLEMDPGEDDPLGPSDALLGRRYGRILLGQFLGATDRANWLSAQQKSGTQLRRENANMDDTIRDQLRALGYAH